MRNLIVGVAFMASCTAHAQTAIIPTSLSGPSCGVSSPDGTTVSLGYCGAPPASLDGGVSFPTHVYGAYQISMVVKGEIFSPDPSPVLQVYLDGTFVGTETINFATYQTVTFPTLWLRTTDHDLHIAFPNTYVLDPDGNYQWRQRIDIQSITLTQLSAPANPSTVQLPDNPGGIQLADNNTIYQATADFTGSILLIFGNDDVLDCQGHSMVNTVIILGNNDTVQNCTAPFIGVYGSSNQAGSLGNHSTIVNNIIGGGGGPYYMLYAGGFFDNQPTSGHLLSGNRIVDTPQPSSDDDIVANDVSDSLIQGNSFTHESDAAFEGIGYWHKILFDRNVFDSVFPIGGWYTDQRTQGFQYNGLTVTNNAFGTQPNGYPVDCYPNTLGHPACDDALASAGPAFDAIGNPKGTFSGNVFGSLTPPPPNPPPGNSPDGSTLVAPAVGSSLKTPAGTWSFGMPYGDPGQYAVFLNGSWASGGYNSELKVDNGGQMYGLNSSDTAWYWWNGQGWQYIGGQEP